MSLLLQARLNSITSDGGGEIFVDTIMGSPNVGLTADAGSGQGDGVITSSYNVYSVVATAGDAATLPATSVVGQLVYIKNDDSTESMDVFPASGDDAGAGTNTAVAISAGESKTFMATVADATWTELIVGGAGGGGGGDVTKVGTPVDNEIGVWTGNGTIEGDANLTWDGSQLLLPQADTPSAPTIGFGDGDSGFYESEDDTITVALGGDGQFSFVTAADADFNSVELLSDNDGADAATTYTERSLNAASATFVGNAQLDTAEFKFGTASMLFDGTGDYVSYPDDASLELGSSAFTIEGWVRFNTLPSDSIMSLVSHWEGVGSDRAFNLFIQHTTAFDFSIGFEWRDNFSGIESGSIDPVDPVVDTWFHFAVIRDAAGALFMWWDGAREFNSAPGAFDGAIDDSTVTVKLGVRDPGDGGSEQFLDGWLDDVRITVGVERYDTSGDLTVPTAAFPLNCIGSFQGTTTGAGKVLNEVASFTNPTLSPYNDDDDTGIGGDGSDALSVIVGGVEGMRFTGDLTDVIQAVESNVGLTADVGSAQGNGVITSSYNIYSTVANAGDAATLPATFIVGTTVYIKNDGANSMDVFPASGDDAGNGTNSAVQVAAGDSATFMATAANATWTKLIEPPGSAGGGNVSNTGTPVNNQLAVWTDATTIEGDADLTYDSATGLFYVNTTNGTSGSVSVASPGIVGLFSASASAAATAGGVVNIFSGAGNTTGAGGLLTIQGGTSGAGATGVGGAVAVTGGASAATNDAGGAVTVTSGAGAGSGSGGVLTLAGGTGYRGGDVDIGGGAGVGGGSYGGDLIIAAGVGVYEGGDIDIDGGSGSQYGGPITITAGTSDTFPGNIDFKGGANTSSGAGGAATFGSGQGGGTGPGGTVNITAGNSGTGATGTGGAINVTSGQSVATNGAGGVTTLSSGAGAGTGAGGLLNITAGASGAGATGDGGAIAITAGTTAATVGSGGDIDIFAGAGVATGSGQQGGDISLTAGAITGSGGSAGQVFITGGTAANAADAGGRVRILAGQSIGGGGALDLIGGTGTGNSTGGAATVLGGAGTGTGFGGAAILTAGDSGSGATGDGGEVAVTGGDSNATNGAGGDIILTPGAGSGSGSAGAINIVQTTAPSSTTDKLYNVAGALTWNGTDLTAGGGGGDVTKVGTPLNNQVGVWTGDGTIEGDADLTFDGTILTTGATGRIRSGFGSFTTPAFSFGSETSTGIYRQAAGSLGISLSGSGNWLFQAGSFFANIVGGPQMMFEASSASNPVFCPRLSDTDSGIGSGAADQVDLIAGGLSCMSVRETGSARQIGFYTTTPISKQTGVGTDAASIHAALVALGLFSA